MVAPCAFPIDAVYNRPAYLAGRRCTSTDMLLPGKTPQGHGPSCIRRERNNGARWPRLSASAQLSHKKSDALLPYSQLLDFIVIRQHCRHPLPTRLRWGAKSSNFETLLEFATGAISVITWEPILLCKCHMTDRDQVTKSNHPRKMPPEERRGGSHGSGRAALAGPRSLRNADARRVSSHRA